MKTKSLFLKTAFAPIVVSGCTALGPMPATTAVGSAPVQRPGLELQVGALPGYYLSSAVQPNPKGTAIAQAAVLVEPDSIIHVPGLVVGGRYVGDSEKGGYPEPMAGYRAFLDENKQVGLSAIGYATRGSGSSKGASYAATRGGAEAGIDFRATPESKWVELHLLGTASVTGISAEGFYCVDAEGAYGVDCPDMMPKIQHATAGGIYPSATGGLSLDFARRFNGEFHGGRLELVVGGGTMPRVTHGQQESPHAYASAGLALSLGFGEGR
jgi:hypothetical protein